MDITQVKKDFPLLPLEDEVSLLQEKMSNAHLTGENISELSALLNYKSELLKRYRTLYKLLDDHGQHREIIDSNDEIMDQEMIDMAKEELPELEAEITKTIEEIKKVEMDRELSDTADLRSAVLEIRAGAGGEEASLFAADLYRMYTTYATEQGWNIEVIDASSSETGGFKEVIALIKGEGVYRKLKYESGVHRVQRIPVTESSGRIHTSTVSVAILPEAKDVDIEIRQEDIIIETMRASGAGGQKTNKTSSAIRITHLPSGIVVSCQETKVQQQNREKAMQILRARLYDMKRSQEAEKRSSLRSSQIGNAMRAEKIRTYNFPQSRITDHRIKSSWHDLEQILSGQIDDLLDEMDAKMKELRLSDIKKEKLKENEKASKQ